MSIPSVSIVITTFNRAPLLENTLRGFPKQTFKDYEVIVIDDGNDAATPVLCAQSFPFPLTYHRMNRDRTLGYNNPARPNNVGVRMARGDIIILQNAEVRHGAGEVIQRLAERCGSHNAVFAQVEVLNEYGMGHMFYCHKTHSPRPFFFCGALRREWFMKLRGFDEERFRGYGYDDVQFADRLTKAGVTFDYTSIEVQHQWHPVSYKPEDPNNALAALAYAKWKHQFDRGTVGIEVNLNHEWGQP